MVIEPFRIERVLKVDLVVSGLMFGGGQRVVCDLATRIALRYSGSKIILLGGVPPEFEYLAPVVVQYDGRYDRPWSVLKTACCLRRVLGARTGGMVHTHGWDADVIGAFAFLSSKKEQLVHLHVTPDWLQSTVFRHGIRRWITKRVLGSSRTRIVAVSDAVRRHWASGLGLDPDSIRVIRNGVDVKHYRPAQSNEPRPIPIVGVAARLAPMKGIAYLLEALGLMALEGEVFHLKIAGTGNLRQSLEQQCGALGIADRVEFLGHVEDMPAFYRDIDIYALPSISTEGLPLGVLEAMASGVPVLATTVAGTPEAVRHGVDGLLVPPRDAQSLVEALRQLFASRDLRCKMGTAGRVRAVESFSLDRFTGEVFDLYREILKGNSI